MVVRAAGDVITVDVKGLAGVTNWPVDNVKAKDNHFLVFVTFLGAIANPTALPEIYVVPSATVQALTYNAPGGRKVVRLDQIRKNGQQYLNRWDQLL
jgi:hypothetical protein